MQAKQVMQVRAKTMAESIYCQCGNVHMAGQRKCLSCHAAYMREWRKTHKLAGEPRRKDIVRHIAGVYKRRGKIEQFPCQICGNPNSEMHHTDYDKPLEVLWLCRIHHLELHNVKRETLEQSNGKPE